MLQNRLNELQRLLLDAFFEYSGDFFLTGGAALVGFHLGHRTTDDLDLFSTKASMEDGVRALNTAVASIQGTIESIITSLDFRRFLVTRGRDSVVVDLVIDRTYQQYDDKLRFGQIRVDPPEEIFANKLCAVLSRGEIRDIVDILKLEQSGLELSSALIIASQKDTGLTPAQLAWVISQITIGDDAKIPAGLAPEDIRTFLADLERRLSKSAFPGP